MRRLTFPALLALALAAPAAAAELEEERAQLEERLAQERAAFEVLSAERTGVLTLLDTLERLARESAERAARFERTLARVTRRATAARAELALAQAALAAQQARVRPRVVALYRLQRQDALGALLDAGDFATLMRRQRALKTLVRADAAALEELELLADAQRLRQHRLDRLEETAGRYVRALQAERAVGQARLGRFQDLLAAVGAEQNRQGRVIAELEASERELTALVAELQATGGTLGLRARRGQLPFPVKGLVEVGFGRVVNPRFNTVTVQKGLDLRAAQGSPVSAIAPGTVVYAGWLKGYGTLVIVDHGDGYHSLYAHLAHSEVEVGNAVEEGERLGAVGDTGSLKGAYLYFEIRKGGQAVDPLPWLQAE
jgi:septal ring factor EnvC (AmiA/AmiB activator)